MKRPRNRNTYILSEIGEQKIIDALINKEVKSRNSVSWLEKETQSIGYEVSKDTIRKILNKKAVEESRIKNVFKALNLSYECDIDSTLNVKDTNIANS